MTSNSALRLFAALSIASLAACGGGGSSSPASTAVAPTLAPTAAPSVKGDMLALKPSQGWNYQSTYQGTSMTLTLYDDPNPVNGVQAFVGAAANGLIATVATSASSMQNGEIGVLGLTVDGSTDYNAVSEVSAGSIAAIPGNPLLVPSSLILGQTWTPYAGVLAKVIAVGTVPNQSVCGASASSGARVEYTYANLDYTVSYVPGCGITDFLNNANGAELNLISTASYTVVGELAVARHAETATLLDTAASLLGQRRTAMPATSVLRAFFH